MATNTTNLNLVKPSLDDWADIRVLNGNMDIIDEEIHKLQDTQEYLPLSGGTVTGDLTVNGNFTNNKFKVTNDDVSFDDCEVIRLIDSKEGQADLTATTGLSGGVTYKYKAYKYSDGTLTITIELYPKAINQYGTVDYTFPIPFVDNSYSVGSIPSRKTNVDGTMGSYEDIMYTNTKTTTGMRSYLGTDCDTFLIIQGRWK